MHLTTPWPAVADPTSQPGGIISVLEAVLSDFEKMEAETASRNPRTRKNIKTPWYRCENRKPKPQQ